MYQVEISANAVPGPSFWFWAELDPGGASGDYQMTDCIHVGRGEMLLRMLQAKSSAGT